MRMRVCTVCVCVCVFLGMGHVKKSPTQANDFRVQQVVLDDRHMRIGGDRRCVCVCVCVCQLHLQSILMLLLQGWLEVADTSM